jgi:aspartyl aminopeptidase
MDQSILQLIQFLKDSPTQWHAVKVIAQELERLGFQKLDLMEKWSIVPAKSYFVVHDSTITAFITPNHEPKNVRLLASHTDSPSLKLKPNSEVRKAGMILFKSEIYGSPLLNSWLNRDLGIAGRVIYLNHENQVKQAVVKLDRHPLTIPQLAIHLDREINEKGLLLNKQEHLNAIAALEASFPENKSLLEKMISEQVDFKEIISHDLFLYPLEGPKLLGFQQELLAAYRIDSLASVYAAFKAIQNENLPDKEAIKMFIFWDNEEVGSQTARGANSPFFNQVINRLLNSLNLSYEAGCCLINRSICVSIDLAHAVHPNHIEKHDQEHQPILGKGIILKTNANQRYATDARSATPIKLLAKIEKLPIQTFVSRNDLPCGSTIGSIQAAQSGMSTVDIGSGQLSMHSCRELMACQDYLDMCKLLSSFLRNELPEIGES